MNGKEVSKTELADDVVFIFQPPENQLFFETVEAEIQGFSKGERQLQTDDLNRLLRAHELGRVRHLPPLLLSRGQKQRLVHASYAALKPQLTIIDEPTRGMDAENIRRFCEIIKRRAAKGFSYILISHNIEFIKAISNKRLAIKQNELAVLPPCAD